MTDQVVFAFAVTSIVLGVIGLLLLVGGFIASVFFKKDEAGEILAAGAGIMLALVSAVSGISLFLMT